MISSTVVTVGVIGLGGMSSFYLQNISRIDSIRVGAICDVNQDLLDKIGEWEGISQDKGFNSKRRIIEYLYC